MSAKRSLPAAMVFSPGSRRGSAEWEQLLASHRARPLIAYHNTWPYFARRFRLDIVDVIEIKEGVTPSPARLAKLAVDDPRTENTRHPARAVRARGRIAVARPANRRGRAQARAIGRQRARGPRLSCALRL